MYPALSRAIRLLPENQEKSRKRGSDAGLAAIPRSTRGPRGCRCHGPFNPGSLFTATNQYTEQYTLINLV